MFNSIFNLYIISENTLNINNVNEDNLNVNYNVGKVIMNVNSINGNVLNGNDCNVNIKNTIGKCYILNEMCAAAQALVGGRSKS